MFRLFCFQSALCIAYIYVVYGRTSAATTEHNSDLESSGSAELVLCILGLVGCEGRVL